MTTGLPRDISIDHASVTWSLSGGHAVCLYRFESERTSTTAATPIETVKAQTRIHIRLDIQNLLDLLNALEPPPQVLSR